MKILIVDDSFTMRLFSKNILQTGGFDIFEADDGETALSVLKKMSRPPDIMLVDWHMKKMAGDEFIRIVREDNRYANTRIIMVTSNNKISDICSILTKGADDYLIKPFEEKSLMTKVNKMIRRIEMRQQMNPVTTDIKTKLDGMRQM